MADDRETRIKSHSERQAEIFSNRLLKRWRHLKKWARRKGITCFRLYDRDIPEIPLAVDIYEIEDEEMATCAQGAAENATLYALLYFYEKNRRTNFCDETLPRQKPSHDEVWLSRMREACAKTLAIDEGRVIVKTRRREKGGGQYADISRGTNGAPAQTISGIVRESGLRFKVDLTDYIDTGLFLDMRLLRQIVRGEAKQKRVLNLYSYTGAFSVCAAAGGAALVDSVDLSNTYLARAKQNMRLNNFTDGAKYRFVKKDVAEFLRRKTPRPAYDLIILDPPTFSNSKMTRGLLDLNKDWQTLVNAAFALLASNGVLYFSTNSRRLKFDGPLVGGSPVNTRRTNGAKSAHSNTQIQEITPRTIDEDFAKKRPHRVWRIVKILILFCAKIF